MTDAADLSSRISEAKSQINDAHSRAESLAEDAQKVELSVKPSLTSEIENEVIQARVAGTGDVALLLEYDNSFWNVEEPGPMKPITRKKKVYIHKSLYWLALCSITWSYSNYVRLPSIIYQMTGFWRDDYYVGSGKQHVAYNMWYFLIPFVIALIMVAWPLMLAEAACGQLAMGGSMKVFGAINPRTRALGTSFLVAIAFCTFLPMYASTSFSYMIRTFYGNEYETQPISGTASPGCQAYEDSMGFQCQTFYKPNDTVQAVNSMLTANGYLRAGLEQAEFSNFSSRAEIRQLADNTVWTHCPKDYSIGFYCAYYQFLQATGDVTPKDSMMVTRYDDWNVSGDSYNWLITAGLAATWVLAGLIACIGPKYSQWIRPFIFLYALGMLFALLGRVCINANDKGGFNSLKVDSPNGVTHLAISTPWQFGNFLPEQLKRPELWSVAISQALFTVGIAQGILPDQQSKNDRITQNVVIDQSISLFSNSILSLVISFLCIMLTSGAGARQASISSGYPVDAVMNQVAVLDPMSEIFALTSGYFGSDISSSNNNVASRRAWAFCWFFGMFIIGVNMVSALLESIVTGFAGFLAKSEWYPRTVWTIAWCCILFAANMIFSWSSGYPFSTGLGHIAVDFFMGFIAYLELVALGWVLHIKKNFRHLGRTATWFHMLGYHIGCWCAGICTGLLYHSDGSSYVRWIGLVVGLIVMLLSVLIPPIFAHKVDFDNKPQSLGQRYKYMLWGQVEQLRRQINITCCFNTKFWRITPVWSILLKYIAPFAVVFAICIPITCLEQLNMFSAYYPFLYESALYNQWAAGYSSAMALPAIYQGCTIIVPCIAAIWMTLTLFLPWMMSYCTPADAKEILFDPLDATGEIANTSFVQYIPIGRSAAEVVAGPETVRQAADLQERAMRQNTSVSSLVSSEMSSAEKRRKKAEKEAKKAEKRRQSELESMQSDMESEAKKREKEARREAERRASELSSLESDRLKEEKRLEKEARKEAERRASEISSLKSERG